MNIAWLLFLLGITCIWLLGSGIACLLSIWHTEHAILLPTSTVALLGSLLSAVIIGAIVTTYLTVRRIDKLETAKNLAEAANRRKGQFLANMSHDIRTPMNAIIGMAHLVLDTNLTTQQQSYIREIDAAARLLLGILNDILDFSKVEAGKLTLEATAFNLQQVITDVLAVVRQPAQSKNLELLVDMRGELTAYCKHHALLGDPLRLGQILANLLSNAVKFTNTGQIRLVVQGILQGTDHIVLDFAVEDTGIGMSTEQITSLFQEFTQAEVATARNYGGTGLGLSISKRLVALMGGELKVNSVPQHGSTFYFTLAFPVTSQIVSCNIDVTAMPVTRQFPGMRVLLVEDNTVNQRLATELLHKRNITIDIANNGVEALERLHALPADHYALVLMDVQMPILNGYETTKILRDDSRYADLPIVAMTAHALLEERQHGLDIGMNGYLTKPFVPEDLFALLSKYYRYSDKESNTPLSPPTAQNVNSTKLCTIPGVNIDAGLSHCADDPDLYLALLQSFYTEYRVAIPRLRSALEAGDWEQSMRIAHTLKGLASTLGMEKVAPVASALEQAAQARDLSTFGLIPPLLATLEPIFEALRRTVSSVATAAGQLAANDPLAGQDNLQRMQTLLSEGDTEALDLWDNCKGQFGAILPTATVQKIDHVLEQFDFTTALTILLETTKKLP